MTAIQHIEIERINNAGTHIPRNDDVERPAVDDGAVADEESETDEERQARESEKAFDQAITRLPPG